MLMAHITGIPSHSVPRDEQTNPTDPETGNCKVFRGRCWSGDSKYCRVTERFYFSRNLYGDLIGLRLAL